MPSSRARYALVCLLLIAAASSAADADDDAATLMARAEAAAEDRDTEAQLRAAALFEGAAARFNSARRRVDEAAAWHGAARCYARATAYEDAMRAADEALQAVDRARPADTALHIRILDTHAAVHYRAGRKQRAVESREAAATIARAAGDFTAEARMLNNLAAVYYSWGDDQRALDAYRQALDLRRIHGIEDGLAANLSNLAIAYVGVGEPERAVPLAAEAVALARKQDAGGPLASALLNLGAAHLRLGDGAQAATHYEEALRLRRETGSGVQVFSPLLSLATTRLQAGRPEEALPLAAEAAAVAADSRLWWQRAHALNLLGRIEAALGRPDAALVRFAAARRAGQEAGEPQLLAEADRYAAEALRDAGRLAEAAARIEAAVAVRESLASGLVSGRYRASARGEMRDYYDVWIDVLARRHEADRRAGHDRAAFAVSERARARTVLELFAGASGADGTMETEESGEKRRRLDDETRSVQRRLRELSVTSDTSAQLAELEARLAALAGERELLEEARRRPAHDSRVLLSVTPSALEAIQAALPDNAVLLEYAVGDGAAFVFVVARDSLGLWRLDADTAALEQLMSRLRTSIAQPARRALEPFAHAARRLYEVLVEPVADELRRRDLVLIAADGPLHYVPFEVLLTASASSAASFAELPYLVREHAIAYLPSASSLQLLARRGATRRRADRMLIVADPDLESRTARPRALEERGRVLSGVFGSSEVWSLGSLESARLEAEVIRNLAGDRRVDLLAGAEATEERLKAHPGLRHGRRLHFATHALVSEREPAYSGLVLALEDGGEEDGLLQVYEIVELELAAELVVLSACQTGLGRKVRGEGLVGLTQAFLAAGAESLVVSLWSVSDRSTADLMAHFYDELDRPASRAAALRAAKLALLDDGLFSHPYHWASFVLQGTPH